MSRLFNGTTSDFLTASIGTLPMSGAYTVSSWIKPVSVSSALVPVGYGSAGSSYWCLLTNASAQAAFERGPAGTDSVLTTPVFTTGTWQHLAAVATSNTSVLVYRNGTAGTADTTNVVPASLTTFDVGRVLINGSSFDFYSGRIGEVAVWNVALSGAQIAALAAGTPPPLILPGNLVAYYQIKGMNSPEPFYPGFGSVNLTVNGTTLALGDDPPVIWPGYPPANVTAAMSARYR